MKYSIVIPTYNHCDDLLKPCVESILKYTDLSTIELIIVANGCTDETVEYLKYLLAYFTNKKVPNNFKGFVSDKPLGYSKAVNTGIKLASAEKIVLLNNDTVLMDQEQNYWLNVLSRNIDNDPLCGISCLIKQFSEAANHSFAVFFCVMIRRKVFETIGFLNEEYGVGFCEDIEFCIEAERAGFKILECCASNIEGNYYVGNFTIVHPGEGTVHDQTLVNNWDEIKLNNQKKIAAKYNPEWLKNFK